MLEAGPPWDTATDSAHVQVATRLARAARHARAPLRRVRRCIGGWQIEGEPYTEAPGTQFDWFRARMLGGRTNHWGRISLRIGPDDFRRKSLDGLATTGRSPTRTWRRTTTARSSSSASSAATRGICQPPRQHLPAAAGAAVLRAADQAGHATSSTYLRRQPALDRHAAPQRPRRVPLLRAVRRGCSTNSNFSSTAVLLPPALATGKLKILTDAMAREVTDRRRTARRPASRTSNTPMRARPRPGQGRRARGQRLRVGAHAAQLEVASLPEQPRPTRAA